MRRIDKGFKKIKIVTRMEKELVWMNLNIG